MDISTKPQPGQRACLSVISCWQHWRWQHCEIVISLLSGTLDIQWNSIVIQNWLLFCICFDFAAGGERSFEIHLIGISDRNRGNNTDTTEAITKVMNIYYWSVWFKPVQCVDVKEQVHYIGFPPTTSDCVVKFSFDSVLQWERQNTEYNHCVLCNPGGVALFPAVFKTVVGDIIHQTFNVTWQWISVYFEKTHKWIKKNKAYSKNSGGCVVTWDAWSQTN